VIFLKNLKSITIVVLSVAIMIVVIVLFSKDYNNYEPQGELTGTVINGAYMDLSTSLTTERYTYIDYLNDLPADSSEYGALDERLVLKNTEALFDNDIQSLSLPLALNETANYEVDLEEEGLYHFGLETLIASATLNNLTLSVKVNGLYLYDDHRAIDIPLTWMDETKEFQVDRYGDQVLPNQVIDEGWRTMPLYNNTYVSVDPLLFNLNEGINTIEITNTTSTVITVGDLTIIAPEVLTSYEQN